jgi:hypothetical protein
MRDLNEFPRLSRRTVLVAAAGAVPLLAGVGGSDTAPKVSQDVVHYQSEPKGDQFCADCKSFVAPTHCKWVAGEISPGGWCRLYKKKSG